MCFAFSLNYSSLESLPISSEVFLVLYTGIHSITALIQPFLNGWIFNFFSVFFKSPSAVVQTLSICIFFLDVYLQGRLEDVGLLSQNRNTFCFMLLTSPLRVIPVCILSSDTRVPISHSSDNMHCFPFPIFANLIGEK